MTATSYVDLNNDDLGANKIFRAATASALDTNPVSIAQRGTGAPWLNGIGAIAKLTTGSGNWTVPAGVYRIKVTATGGGGGGGYGGSAGTGGTNTTFSTLTAGGGTAGDGAGACTGSASATGGTLNLRGMTAGASKSGGSFFGDGGSISGVDVLPFNGGGGYPGGGGGATCIGVLSVDPGDLIAYAVGGGGAGGGTGQAGATGIIIIEY